MKWLNRKEFHKLALIDRYEPMQNLIYYDGSFNINRIQFGGILIGLELTFVQSRPFGYTGQVTRKFTIEKNGSFVIGVESDEFGTIAPDQVKITLYESGDLYLSNDREYDGTCIKNCSSGEVITINCVSQIAQTQVQSHKLYDDFNFHFIGLVNQFGNNINTITASIPCTIEIKYTPICKVVF